MKENKGIYNDVLIECVLVKHISSANNSKETYQKSLQCNEGIPSDEDIKTGIEV